jgi:hypothetical protein
MKYRITPTDDRYELTLIPESYEDHVILHDEVACKIAESSEFIGDVFRSNYDGPKHCEGVVPLRDGLIDEQTP